MAGKKSVAPKKAAKAEKKPSPAKVWSLPIAMLMLTIGAAGLFVAMRDSSNETHAATPGSVTVAVPTDNKTPAKSTVSTPSPKAVSPMASAPATTPEPGTVDTKSTSIVGCLQRTDRGFLLKDTQGADAPTSRSWKSGFFKRSPSSIVLSDKANAAHLADHVGQRVSVTGPLADREMRVVSLRRVAASCAM